MKSYLTAELCEIATVARGKFSARPRNDPKFYGGRYPFVQTGDVASANGRLRTHSQTLNEDGLSVSKLFPSGTILLTIAANIGEVALTEYPVACPDSVIGIEPNEGINHSWLLHALMSKKPVLEAAATQNAQKNINLQVVRPLEIDVPPEHVQRKLGAIFDTWDRAVDLTEKLLAEKQALRSGLMHELLTGKRRLSGFNVQWQKIRLDKVFERVQRTIPEGETPEVLSITAKVGFVSQREKFSKVIAGKNIERYVLLRQGEFAYNKGNSKSYNQGCIYQLKEFFEGAVPNVYLSLRAIQEIAHAPYFAHYFEAGSLNHQLSRVINTGVRNDGLLNLNAKDFFSVEVDLPPIAEQRAIASLLDASKREIELLKAKNDALREQKKGLMQQLLTGKKRVTACET